MNCDGFHRSPPDVFIEFCSFETENVFRAENAAKRNMATRQPARDVSPVLKNGSDFELDIFSFT
jgi:hypothetical protein